MSFITIEGLQPINIKHVISIYKWTDGQYTFVYHANSITPDPPPPVKYCIGFQVANGHDINWYFDTEEERDDHYSMLLDYLRRSSL